MERLAGSGKAPPPNLQVNQQVEVFDSGNFEARDASKKILLFASLRSILLEVPNSRIMVFVRDRSFCELVCSTLCSEGHKCEQAAGSQVKQAGRVRLISELNAGLFRMLVATDGIAESLVDLNPRGITHLINFDWCDVEDYAKRLRIVTAGGLAITFFEYDENSPGAADAFVRMLEASGQQAPPALISIAREVKHGRRSISKMFSKKKRKEEGRSWGAGWSIADQVTDPDDTSNAAAFLTWDVMSGQGASSSR